MGEGHGAHRRGEMRGMGGILLGKAYLGSMEGVHPARMAQPCGYVGEEKEERDETSRQRPGTGRPSYGKELPPTLDLPKIAIFTVPHRK